MPAAIVTPESRTRPSQSAPAPEHRRGWFFAAVLAGLPMVNLCLGFIAFAAMSEISGASEESFLWVALPSAIVVDMWILAPLSRRAGWGWSATPAGTAAAIALSVAYPCILFFVWLSIACGGVNACFS